MKLQEYMATHHGDYTLAETMHPITPQDLDPSWAEMEVEPHLVGTDAAGRRKIHLYAADRRLHLATHVEPAEHSSE